MSRYTIVMREAAHRHRRCADRLLQDGEVCEAGYLFGLAAECAVKEMSATLPCLRRKDLLYSHFPELRDLVLDSAEGRGTERLKRLMRDGSRCLGGWHVSIRYDGNRAVSEAQAHQWRQDANEALSLMDAP